MNALLVEQPLRRLPFGFAKRHGVLLLAAEPTPCLAYRPAVELVALAEAQRFLGQRLPLRAISAPAFEQALAKAYQHEAGAMQLAEGLGGSLDLAALAEQVPQIEDLLEQEDDAPIIVSRRELFSHPSGWCVVTHDVLKMAPCFSPAAHNHNH